MLQRRSLPALVLALAAAGQAAGADYYVRDRDAEALVAAIRHAQATPGADTIHLHPGGVYPLLAAAEPGLGLPPLRGELRIEGHGAEIRRYTDARMALVSVAEGARVSLRGLTLAEGSRGALANAGTLELEDVRVVDSTGSEPGGIVRNSGRLLWRDGEIAHNQVLGSSGHATIVLNEGELVLERTGVHSNSASRGDARRLAAVVLNFGSIVVDAVRLEGNEIADHFGAPAHAGLLSVAGGRVAGELATGAVASVAKLPAGKRSGE